MAIPLTNDDPCRGQRFAQAYPDIQGLRDAWVNAIDKKDWALAALYQVDIEKRRDQMILSRIERSENTLITFIMIFGSVLLFALAGFIHFSKI